MLRNKDPFTKSALNASLRFFVLISYQIYSSSAHTRFFSPRKVIRSQSFQIIRILRALLAPQVYYLTCRVASLTAVLTFHSLTPRNNHLKCAPLFGRSRSNRMRETRRMRPTELMRQGSVADPACHARSDRLLALSHVASPLIRGGLLTFKNHFDCM